MPPLRRLLSLGAPVASDIGLQAGLLQPPTGELGPRTSATGTASELAVVLCLPPPPPPGEGNRDVPANRGSICLRGCTPVYCPWSAAGRAQAQEGNTQVVETGARQQKCTRCRFSS